MGFAVLALTVAASVWPEHSDVIAKVIGGLSGAGLLVAADGNNSK